MVALFLFLKGMIGALAPFGFLVINIIDSTASFFLKERERQKVKDAKIREMALAQKQRMLQQQHVKSNAMFRR